MTKGRQPRTPAPLERRLRPGWFTIWNDDIYEIGERDPADPLKFEFKPYQGGESLFIRLEQLIMSSDEGSADILVAATYEELMELAEAAAPLNPAPAAGDLPKTFLKRADAMLAAVEQIDAIVADDEARARARGEAWRRTAAVMRACASLNPPISPATYYRRRLRIANNEGQRARIAASMRRRTFGKKQATPAQFHFVDTMIMRFYTRHPPIRPISLYRIAMSTLERTRGYWVDPTTCKTVPPNLIEELLDKNLPIDIILSNPDKAALLTPIKLPSRGWFFEYLHYMRSQPQEGKTIFVKRYGQEAWEHHFMVFDTFLAKATLPLQYVFVDHWLLDVFTVDEATRSETDRLWVTVLIDAFSRSVLGFALLYEPPCIESIQSALRHGIWPKTSHTEFGIDLAWDCFGIPQYLFLDNAWAHHSHSVEDLARSISQGGKYNAITPMFRPPYKGRYGALIERFFGNLSRQVKEWLRGSIQSSDPKAIRNAAREACLLYQDIDRFLHRVILKYQHTPHSELEGNTPHEKWLEGIQLIEPMVPRKTKETERLFWRMDPNPRIISRNGISAFGMHYWSPEISGIKRVGTDGKPLRYSFRYETEDISHLALFRDGKWVGDVYAKELRLADGSTMSISRSERKLAAALAKKEGHPAQDWLAFVSEIDKTIKQREAEKRKAAQSAKQGDQVKARPRLPTLDDARKTKAALDALEQREQGDDLTNLLAGFGQ